LSQYIKNKVKPLIVKELIEYETESGKTLTGPSACHQCASPCLSFNAATDSKLPASVGRPVRLALNNRRLHEVVVVLFGVPLLLLVGLVVLIESCGFSHFPLTCFTALIGVLFVWFKLIAPQGTNLLNRLQVQRLPAFTHNSRNTA
jgi:hypothetical protein